MQGKRRIIVVDDEPDTVKFLCTWLQDLGFDVSSAPDGIRGLKLIKLEGPDLILLDLKMPAQTGLQLYREICLDESLQSIPVILITGMTEFQLIDNECSPLPAPAACLEKPIDLIRLRAAIEQAIC